MMPKPKIDLQSVQEMLLAGVPRKHITEVSGLNRSVLSVLAQAWGIVARRGRTPKRGPASGQGSAAQQ